MYIVLAWLYESYIHPITILSTLRRGPWARCSRLMLSRTDLGVISLDRHRASHRHREEERDHDDRTSRSTPSAGRGRARAKRYSRRPAVLPADPHDDDGGACSRRCR